MAHKDGSYYLPTPSSWPIKACIALFCMVVGAANWLHDAPFGPYLFGFGILMVLYIMFGWFGVVIKENRAGLLCNPQVDRSFRRGMLWFIFSEVMFFGVFFGALFYVRAFVVPSLAGSGDEILSHLLLWPQFQAKWPILQNPDQSVFAAPRDYMHAWGIPALNTLVLLTSGVTVTIAHWALLKEHRKTMLISQFLTVLLGASFLALQAHEYTEAYLNMGLTLGSGIYGTIFFMLTGFHGLHVTVGTIGLIIIFYRMLRGDFTPDNHFAFEAVSWYWHFVDVVWLLLFVFVYWM